MNKRTIYRGDHLTREMLNGVVQEMGHQDLKQMTNHLKDIIGTHIFGTHETRLVAEDMFKLGYLAAHIEMPDRDGK